MAEEKMIIEDVSDPQEKAAFYAGQARFELNRDWLESHWDDLLPQAAGRFVAVAGQQAHLADTVDSAWAWIDEHHPDDDGAFVRFVRKHRGPRFYATVG